MIRLLLNVNANNGLASIYAHYLPHVNSLPAKRSSCDVS